MNKKANGKVWIVEARLENTRESVATSRFETVEDVVGSREDAERCAQKHLYKRIDRIGTVLKWVDGINGDRSARYAFNPSVTYRITKG